MCNVFLPYLLAFCQTQGKTAQILQNIHKAVGCYLVLGTNGISLFL